MSEAEHRIPVTEEVLAVGKRAVTTGTVRVETRTATVEELAEVDLAREEVEVTRVPVGREVDAAPSIRTEGEVTIVPIVEERVFVERRLYLREEIHLRRHRTVETVAVPVELRRQEVRIVRDDAEDLQRSETMTDLTTDAAMSGGRTLTAFFDELEKAEDAQRALLDLGLPDATIRLTGGEEYAGHGGYREDRGFWDSVHDFFFPNDDAATYAEGLRRGGYLLAVSGVPSDRYDQALDILDAEGSVDLDERASSWRSEGWSGADDLAGAGDFGGAAAAGATAGIGAGAAAGAGVGRFDAALTDVPQERGLADRGSLGEAADSASWREGDSGAADRGTARTGDETIPVIEERLRVGKRDVNLGRVRVRSYVVEEPATADVSLREERVEVERRPVDRELRPGEEAFVDRTIEAEEHAEEAVIGKEARVTEEIGLRRESEEHTETVSDTVRRTRVEVEDDRDDALREEALDRRR
ncbi:MAG: YsnF/AvaK domain-containing protein [Amaricoccus sp.]